MIASDCVIAWGEVNIIFKCMHERECKGYISFNRGVNEFNRGVNELNRGVNDLNRGVNHSVVRQGCNLLRAAVTSAVTSQGCCCGNLQIHPLDLTVAARKLVKCCELTMQNHIIEVPRSG